jgi:hypothetical protein
MSIRSPPNTHRKFHGVLESVCKGRSKVTLGVGEMGFSTHTLTLCRLLMKGFPDDCSLLTPEEDMVMGSWSFLAT